MHLPNTSEKKLSIAIPLNLVLYPFGFWYLGVAKHFWGHLFVAILIQFILQTLAWIFLQFSGGLTHLILFCLLAPLWWTFVTVATIRLQQSHKAINLKWGFIALIGAFTILILFEPTPRVLMNAHSIRSMSMAPSLQVGDYVFADLMKRKPKRGDLITFAPPGDEEKLYLKRVIGIPGDIVEVKYDVEDVGKLIIERARFIVNSQSLTQKPIEITEAGLKELVPPDADPVSAVFFEETNGEHRYPVAHVIKSKSESESNVTTDTYGQEPMKLKGYFVVGDNRDRSSDSRVWGEIPPENIKGTYAYTYFGLDFFQSECPEGFPDWQLSDMLAAGCSFPPVRPKRIGFVVP